MQAPEPIYAKMQFNWLLIHLVKNGTRFIKEGLGLQKPPYPARYPMTEFDIEKFNGWDKENFPEDHMGGQENITTLKRIVGRQKAYIFGAKQGRLNPPKCETCEYWKGEGILT